MRRTSRSFRRGTSSRVLYTATFNLSFVFSFFRPSTRFPLNVVSLEQINAFKTAYAYSTSGAARLANPNAGGRTGLPQQQGRTPAHPSGRTPAPNPYAQQGGRTPAGGYAQQGGRTPAVGYGQQQQQPGGGRTPAPGAYGGGYGGGATPNPAYGGGGGGGGYGQLPPGVAAAQQAAAQQAIPGFGGGRTPNIYGPPAGRRSPDGGVGGGGMTPGGYGRGY